MRPARPCPQASRPICLAVAFDEVTRDIGSPRVDAQSAFARARRRRALALLSARLRREPDEVAIDGPRNGQVAQFLILPFEEVVEVLGAHRGRAAARRIDAADRRLPRG